MLSKKNFIDIIQEVKPNNINEYFFYDGVSRKTVERFKLFYSNYKETYCDSNIQYTDDFNVNFFPINFFFTDTQKLKEICDTYKISFEIHIDTTGDQDFEVTPVGENIYSIRYNSKPTINQCCLISILDIKTISDEGFLDTVLNDINKLILKEIEREIFFDGWRSEKVNDILRYFSIMEKCSNDKINQENRIISLEDNCRVILPKEICKKDKILYNLKRLQYPLQYYFQIDISDMRDSDNEIVLCESYMKNPLRIQSESSESSESSDRKSEKKEIRFIVTYTLPYLDSYISKKNRRPKFRYLLKDDMYLIQQEIIYEVTPQPVIV